jgi:glycosyltransferase involved in cell wall biosynthesis
MNRSLGTIAVDLTPVLPGGDNGGAKIFVVQLLQTVARMTPSTQFVLLTQASSHEELAALDAPNVRRLLVIADATHRKTMRDRLRSLGRRIRPLIPSGLHAALKGAGKRMTSPAPMRGAGGMLRDLKADLLFCPFTAPTYFEPGIPTVCTIYDLQYRTYPEFFDPDDVAHRDHTFREACRVATELAAISEYSRQSAIAHGNVDPSRIRTIYLRMAQRMSSSEAEASNVVSRLGLAAGRYLIYPANFWKHKNHEMLLTAFGIACRGDFPADIKLVCTGAPGARQRFLAESAQAMQLGSRVVFPGFLPDRELAALMKQSAAVIFPSLYEGFGLPLIEAMAVGVPVGCSNATSLPEVASGAALLFDPRIPQEIAQTMLSLVADRAARDRLIRAGRERAAEFSDVERMAHEYIQIFADSLSKGKLETMMAGVFADGWAGQCLKIQLAPAADNQGVLEIEFSAPDWLPQPRLVVQASHDGRKIGTALQLQRGTAGVLSVPVDETGGYYEISIAPTFVPARIGHGSDMRELSAMLRRCDVSRGPAGKVQLFPAENRE